MEGQEGSKEPSEQAEMVSQGQGNVAQTRVATTGNCMSSETEKVGIPNGFQGMYRESHYSTAFTRKRLEITKYLEFGDRENKC